MGKWDEIKATPGRTPDELRPILIADHVPAQDGNTYQVFVDVNDRELRAALRQYVAGRMAGSLFAVASLTMRVVAQP